MNKLNMNWPDRFALIQHYSPTDTQVCAAFGLTQDELDTARQLKAAGTFQASATLDVARYANVFTTGAAPVTTSSVKTSKPTSATTFVKPETAAKKAKVPQKRGRKGDKITTALASVPTSQVPVETFMSQYGVSLAVLRQAKRFISKLPVDQAAAIGKINVRQDKATKALLIWREPLGT